jgi:transcriptional regulator with XRE-family HTH domain
MTGGPMREGTALQLGLDGRTLAHMARRGQAERIGETGKRTHRVHIWRVREEPTPPTTQAHLRKMRLEVGMTLDNLADASGVGRTTIQTYELKDASPSMLTIYAVLDALGFRFAELAARIYGKPAPERLPASHLFPLDEAQVVAFDNLAPGYRLPPAIRRGQHQMRYWTTDEQCHRAGLDPVAYWQQVDARLRWTR